MARDDRGEDQLTQAQDRLAAAGVAARLGDWRASVAAAVQAGEAAASAMLERSGQDHLTTPPRLDLLAKAGPAAQRAVGPLARLERLQRDPQALPDARMADEAIQWADCVLSSARRGAEPPSPVPLDGTRAPGARGRPGRLPSGR